MLSVRGRKPMSVIIEPVARALTRLGLSPNTVTVVGALCTTSAAVILIPTGHLVAAAVLTAVFAAFDLVDGTMARMRGRGTKFGAILDATCDRITDGALFGAITWWLIFTYHAHPAVVVASFVVIVSSQVISYIKARSEASGIEITGGLIERAERLIIGVLGIGLAGLGVPWVIDGAVVILALGSVYTVVQRLYMAAQSEQAEEAIKAPAGAKEYP